MADKFYTSVQVLTLLADAPPKIAALTTGLSAAKLRARPEPDAWSINEVLAHLRACADVWGGYIARILAEDTPTFRAVSPRTYIHKTDYPELEFTPSLAAFTAQRDDLLAVLAALPPESWSRAANVTGAGRRLTPTVLSYCDRMARHEQEHLRQIEQIVALLRPLP